MCFWTEFGFWMVGMVLRTLVSFTNHTMTVFFAICCQKKSNSPKNTTQDLKTQRERLKTQRNRLKISKLKNIIQTNLKTERERPKKQHQRLKIQHRLCVILGSHGCRYLSCFFNFMFCCGVDIWVYAALPGSHPILITFPAYKPFCHVNRGPEEPTMELRYP